MSRNWWLWSSRWYRRMKRRVRSGSSMTKPRKILRVRLPEYVTPRFKWRQLILRETVAEQQRLDISYGVEDKLEVHVRLYLRGAALTMHDVDNRLKDILDALQGRVGGGNKRRRRPRVILNDSQIWRAVIEKASPPPQSHGLGHLTIRGFRSAAQIQPKQTAGKTTCAVR